MTRALGALGFLYALVGDHTADRATIIITSAGLLGLDKVARSEDVDAPRRAPLGRHSSRTAWYVVGLIAVRGIIALLGG